MSLKKTLQAIKKYKSFLITTHVNPDPDAICSELALAEALESLKRKVVIVNEEEVPARFSFLPGASKIKSISAKNIADYDAVIVLDCGDLSRIGKVKEIIKKDAFIINIDHHVTNDSFGSLNWIQPSASSTSEMLYELIVAMKCPLTKAMAENLYAGIMTDTGSFRYENTTSSTHKIVSELVKFNFKPNVLYRKLYETIPATNVLMFAKVLNRFEILMDGKVICLTLPKSILAEFSEDFDLRDAIFKFLRAIKGVEVIVIFSEVSLKETRINFRSIERVDVAKLAHYFNGGGHSRASGCMIGKNIKQSRQDVLKKLKTLL